MARICNIDLIDAGSNYNISRGKKKKTLIQWRENHHHTVIVKTYAVCVSFEDLDRSKDVRSDVYMHV